MSRIKLQEVLARDTADATRVEMPTLTTVETVDSNGFPVVTVGSIAISGGGAYLSFVTETTLQVDSLGNSQRVYAPSRIRVALEASATAGSAIMSSADQAKLNKILGKWGTKVELWLETNGTAPSATTFNTASKKVADLYPDVYNPLRSQM